MRRPHGGRLSYGAQAGRADARRRPHAPRRLPRTRRRPADAAAPARQAAGPPVRSSGGIDPHVPGRPVHRRGGQRRGLRERRASFQPQPTNLRAGAWQVGPAFGAIYKGIPGIFARRAPPEPHLLRVHVQRPPACEHTTLLSARRAANGRERARGHCRVRSPFCHRGDLRPISLDPGGGDVRGGHASGDGSLGCRTLAPMVTAAPGISRCQRGYRKPLKKKHLKRVLSRPGGWRHHTRLPRAGT